MANVTLIILIHEIIWTMAHLQLEQYLHSYETLSKPGWFENRGFPPIHAVLRGLRTYLWKYYLRGIIFDIVIWSDVVLTVMVFTFKLPWMDTRFREYPWSAIMFKSLGPLDALVHTSRLIGCTILTILLPFNVTTTTSKILMKCLVWRTLFPIMMGLILIIGTGFVQDSVITVCHKCDQTLQLLQWSHIHGLGSILSCHNNFGEGVFSLSPIQVQRKLSFQIKSILELSKVSTNLNMNESMSCDDLRKSLQLVQTMLPTNIKNLFEAVVSLKDPNAECGQFPSPFSNLLVILGLFFYYVHITTVLHAKVMWLWEDLTRSKRDESNIRDNENDLLTKSISRSRTVDKKRLLFLSLDHAIKTLESTMVVLNCEKEEIKRSIMNDYKTSITNKDDSRDCNLDFSMIRNKLDESFEYVDVSRKSIFFNLSCMDKNPVCDQVETPRVESSDLLHNEDLLEEKNNNDCTLIFNEFGEVPEKEDTWRNSKLDTCNDMLGKSVEIFSATVDCFVAPSPRMEPNHRNQSEFLSKQIMADLTNNIRKHQLSSRVAVVREMSSDNISIQETRFDEAFYSEKVTNSPAVHGFDDPMWPIHAAIANQLKIENGHFQENDSMVVEYFE